MCKVSLFRFYRPERGLRYGLALAVNLAEPLRHGDKILALQGGEDVKLGYCANASGLSTVFWESFLLIRKLSSCVGATRVR